ncbi:hypothetical protein HGM15179_020283 [Zosterops borbonicus]|uniref:Uncharacterized protein n=1 Tax=Zosterops borbonicus TaxID=364589 RepID=A0A8K1D6L7_9PASS|nr:hypothetical protein HGM15179_020283 [Zosterops borbonicus]
MKRQTSLQSSVEGPIGYPAGLTLPSYRGGAFSKGDLRFGLAVVPLKSILAAGKMVYLAVGCNLTDEGKGRGICLWGVLLVLSLAMCEISGVHTNDQLSTERQGLMDECKQSLRAILKGQEVPKGIANRAQFDCQNDMEREHCTYNGTQYKMCELEGEIICRDPREESKNRQSEAPSSHVLHKRDVEGITTIPTCNQCNRTVWIGDKTKSTFVRYFQVFLADRSVKLLEFIATWNRLEKVLNKLQLSSSEDSSSLIRLDARGDGGIIPPVPALRRRAGQPIPLPRRRSAESLLALSATAEVGTESAEQTPPPPTPRQQWSVGEFGASKNPAGLAGLAPPTPVPQKRRRKFGPCESPMGLVPLAPPSPELQKKWRRRRKVASPTLPPMLSWRWKRREHSWIGRVGC